MSRDTFLLKEESKVECSTEILNSRHCGIGWTELCQVLYHVLEIYVFLHNLFKSLPFTCPAGGA